MINADKPHLWKNDVAASVDLYNNWFMRFAPKTYRDKRTEVTKQVETGLLKTGDLENITPAVLQANPAILPMLRMATCPPLARDRLVGLAYADKNVVLCMEDGACPPRISAADLRRNLERIVATLTKLLDRDIFPWLAARKKATKAERARASTIVADRMCGAQSDPIIRNAQEARQLKLISGYLTARSYVRKNHPSSAPITEMPPGTFGLRMGVVGIQIDRDSNQKKVNIPIDVVIQPHNPRRHRVPILIECKSAGDFTNVNKRRKEEAAKIGQIHNAPDTGEAEFILFLCGYFDGQYLGYEAFEGIDWIWEHRIEDMDQLGL
ncbi:MAG: XamI family restriction endonuclease [Bryobacteraceae bacterium]